MNIPPITKRIRQCLKCGVEFETTNPRGFYCEKCHFIKCAVCGNEFRAARLGVGAQKTCSKKCGSILAQKDRVRSSIYCHHCGKEFYPSNGHLGMKYCSQDCRYASKRKDVQDKNRTSYQYKHWRKSVFKRDDYTCQHCGSTSDLQAHHIKEWRDYPDLRYEVSNGVTVCVNCHSKIHGSKTGHTKTKKISCELCGKTIGGRGITGYCRSCSLKKSAKAILSRLLRTRNKDGQFSTMDEKPL